MTLCVTVIFAIVGIQWVGVLAGSLQYTQYQHNAASNPLERYRTMENFKLSIIALLVGASALAACATQSARSTTLSFSDSEAEVIMVSQ